MKVAFLFDEEVRLPPSFDNIKCYYISKELVRRGISVSWVQLGSVEKCSREDGIRIQTIPNSKMRFISVLVSIFRLLLYCKRAAVEIVYVDEWLYFRHRPLRRFLTQVGVRVLRMKLVIDWRDPFVDFEVARGTIRIGTLKYKLLRFQEKVSIYLSNLVILPSDAYAKLLVSEGAPVRKVAGYFRGVDTKLFNPNVDGSSIKIGLGLQGKFVIGWFGMMYKYRLVREVLVPIAKNLHSLVPDGHLVIGGKGPLEDEFVKLLNEFPNLPVSYVGLVPYAKLPSYLAACDLLLCQVSTDFRFSRYSNWLKIPEALAAGRPIVATRTEITGDDFASLRGILWTGTQPEVFLSGVLEARKKISQLREQARYQADRMREFSIDSTMPRIVDRILEA